MVGHNPEKSDREKFEDQQIIKAFGEIEELESQGAGVRGKLGNVYKEVAKYGGFTKADIKWAVGIKDEDAPAVYAEMKRRFRLMGILGFNVSAHRDLFEGADLEPLEDKAFTAGLKSGRWGQANVNPYGGDHEAHQAWQRGYNQGADERKESLEKAADFLAEEDSLIKGADTPGEGDDTQSGTDGEEKQEEDVF